MKFTSAIISSTLIAASAAVPVRLAARVAFDASLVPLLGFHSGVNPTGTGDCDGAVKGSNGQPIKVPCACPPDQNTFNQAVDTNVQAGFAVNNPSVKVSFPLDSSTSSQITRLQAALVTLQNLNGPGKGCPAASTTLGSQLSALQNPGSAPAPAPAPAPAQTSPAAASSPAATAPASGSVPFDASLVPSLGFTAGKNPTGTGDCDGAVNGADGKPIKVPCACPPDQSTFNQAVDTNVQAGFAVHNPSVKVSFPLDSSTASQITRIQAALVTLQNLNGPGQGCPAASTTLSSQLSALQNPQSAAAPPQNVAVAASPKTSSAAAASSTPAATSSGSVPFNANLVPLLGFTSGKNPTGTGDCDGAVNGADGKPIKIPCACPPDQNTFNQAVDANVQAGFAIHNPSVKVNFPLDNSTSSQITRMFAAIDTLQNLNGPGQGCPAVSTTFSAQLAALQNPQAANSAAPAKVASAATPTATVASTTTAAAAPATTTTDDSEDSGDSGESEDCPSAVTVTVTEGAEPTEAAASTGAPAITSSASAASSTAASSSSSSSSATFGGLTLSQIDALTPQFGHASGVNPTGTGNCDGAVNGSDGKPIQVPCSCPPPRDQFIQSLADDIAAGHAVHNPSVGVKFPTDNSAASQRTRIQAALVALQNLNGSGVGCPASSTTFLAQLNAIQG